MAGSRRRPASIPVAPQRIMEIPYMDHLQYAPLPYQTHPIDTYHGPQGWGPFWGPWTPWDWHDPAVHISDRYGSGESNEWEFAPPADILTLFHDHSLGYVANTSYQAEAQRSQAEQELSYTSTISNAVPAQGSFLQRLRELFATPSQGGE